MVHVAREVNVREKTRTSVDMARPSSKSGHDPYCRYLAGRGLPGECCGDGVCFHGEVGRESILGGRRRNRGYLLP
jgi:hypothetical protein